VLRAPAFRTSALSAGRQDTKGIPLASQNNNGGQGGPWGSGGRRDSDFENLVRQGQDRLKQVLPAGGPRSMIALVILAVAGLAVWTAYYTVPSDSVAVVQRFGKYLKDVPPGLHFKLPLGIDVATIVPVKRQLKQEFGFATPGAADPYQTSRDGKRETQMVTGDLNAYWWNGWFNIASWIRSNSFSMFANREERCATCPNLSCGRSSAIAPWTR
jgi:hypothetical protein